MEEVGRETRAATAAGESAAHATPHGLLAPGDVVGGYRVEAVAGRGGMGVVYRATDPVLGRAVALKLISGGRAGDPRFRELFVRESMTAAALEHPNVIPIYRAGDDDGRLFIAMRFVDGASLEEVVERSGPLPAGRAARIVARAADALAAAHARGLVHRDVKPANVLIADPDGDEHVYLTDFGLSVQASSADGPGGWAGTLAYLAPEQVLGEPVDARTDVYALGCVLFHALTGRAPFTGTREEVLEAHVEREAPRVTDHSPDMPPALDDVVRRAMAKRPENRFQTADALGRAALAARFDVALCYDPADGEAAEWLAGDLREKGLAAALCPAGDPSAVAGAVGASESCAVLVGPGGLGDWARPALRAATDVAERDRGFRLVSVLLPGGPRPMDPGLSFMATHPWVDLRPGARGPEAADALLRALRGAAPPILGEVTSDECPYRGLEPFGEEDAGVYVGREDDVSRVLELLGDGRFVALIGASGSGKSSLMHAGVVPALRASGEPVRVLPLVPGERPLAALAAAVASLPGAGSPSPADLAADVRALDDAAGRALAGRPPSERVLVVVDQMEEAFTLCADEGERAAFFGALTYAATIPGGRVGVIVAMRGDFYHRLARYPEMRVLASRQQYLVGPMDAKALRRVIEEPARHAGLELEPGLTRRILADVADRPGTLPLLEHLLLELWLRRRGRLLTLEAYGATGGVEGALAGRAEAVYAALPPERQVIARRVLLRLTQPGEGTEDTRRRASMDELVTSEEERPEVEAVVGALAEGRLVTVSTVPGSTVPVVDLAHEALIRGWPRLRNWIDEDREALRLQRRLTDASAEWLSGGREDGALYRGARLLAWDGRPLDDLSPVEREFLEASRGRAESERARRRRTVRGAIGVLAGAVVVIAALWAFALVQRSNANEQKDVARSRQIAANARAQLASDPELALLLALRAQGISATAESEQVLRLAAHASQVRRQFPGHTGQIRGTALTPAGRVLVTASADGTLRMWDIRSGSALRRVQVDPRGVDAMAMRPDGREVITVGPGGVRRVAVASGRATRGGTGLDRRGPATGGPVAVVVPAGASASTVAAGPAGLVAVGREDGAIVVSARSGSGTRLSAGGSPVRALALSPDGRALLSGADDGAVLLWRRTGDAWTSRPLPKHSNIVTEVAFTRDGRTALSASRDATVRVFAVASPGKDVALIKIPEVQPVFSAAFSDDGRLVAMGLGDASVRVWRVAGAEQLAVMNGNRGNVEAVTFTPDGRGVVSGGDDGSVRLWAWSDGIPMIASLPSATPVGPVFPLYGGLAWTADGRTVRFLDGDSPTVGTWRPGSAPSAVDPGSNDALAGALSPDGTRMAVSRVSGGDIVELAVGSPASRVLRGHDGLVYSMAYSPDGREVVSAGVDGTVRVWPVTGGAPVVVRASRDGLRAVAALPGGLVAAGADDGTVVIVDPARRRVVRRLRGHVGQVRGLAVSPDGRRLASASADKSVRVWDLTGGEPPRILRGHDGGVFGVSFGGGGSLLVTAGEDQTIVWDWARGVALESVPVGASYAALDPRAREIALITADGKLAAAPCDVCGSLGSVMALARGRVTRALTPDEISAFAPAG